VRRKFKIVAGVVAAAVAATALTAIAVPADARENTKLDPAQVAGSIAYLRGAYGVSQAEALRRLSLQAYAEKLDGALQQQAPGSYAGLWLDQKAGGRLVVAATSPAGVAGVLKGAPDRGHVGVRRVRHTLADLRALRDRLTAQFGAGPDAVLIPQVAVDSNQVVVWKRDWVAQGFTAQSRTALDKAVAESGGTVAVRPMIRPNPLSTKDDYHTCFALYCTGYGAMRGGLRLDIQRDNGTFGGCTSGFNARARGGQYAGQGFVLTAGHCVASGTHTHLDYGEHQHAQILQEVPALAVNAFPRDYAFLRYTDQRTQRKWLDWTAYHNLVLAYCRNGSPDSTRTCRDGDYGNDHKFRITGVTPLDQVVVGSVVCASGAGASDKTFTDVYDSGAGENYLPGTRCGVVDQVEGDTIDTNLCARRGDSGGPLFSEVSSTGLGILEGNLENVDRSGPCVTGERNNYISLSRILGWVNASPGAAGSTFEIITDRLG
jgi:streptogrisin C